MPDEEELRYVNGGCLPLGLTWAYNDTGQPELVCVPFGDGQQDDDDA